MYEIIFKKQENEQRRQQEEKAERRRKAQAEIKLHKKGIDFILYKQQTNNISLYFLRH